MKRFKLQAQINGQTVTNLYQGTSQSAAEKWTKKHLYNRVNGFTKVTITEIPFTQLVTITEYKDGEVKAVITR